MTSNTFLLSHYLHSSPNLHGIVIEKWKWSIGPSSQVKIKKEVYDKYKIYKMKQKRALKCTFFKHKEGLKRIS